MTPPGILSFNRLVTTIIPKWLHIRNNNLEGSAGWQPDKKLISAPGGARVGCLAGVVMLAQQTGYSLRCFLSAQAQLSSAMDHINLMDGTMRNTSEDLLPQAEPYGQGISRDSTQPW